MNVCVATNKIGNQVFKILKKEGNFIFSPFALLTNLAMVAMGAVGGTYLEIIEGMHLGDYGSFRNINRIIQDMEAINKMRKDTEKTTNLQMFNTTFLDYTGEVDQNYKESLLNLFHANIHQFDLSEPNEVASLVNNLVSAETGGKVTEFTDEDNVKQWRCMVLLNMLTFTGKWAKNFHVIQREFKNFDGGKLFSDMIQTKSDFKIMNNNATFKMIEIPYKDSDIVMQILLPKAGSSLDEALELMDFYISQMSLDEGEIFKKFQKMQRTVYLTLPKFHLKETHDLVPLLKKMGMKRMFTYSGDFSEILDHPFCIGNASQNVQINVDENGTEVASADGCDATFFTVDKPFLFYLRDRETGLLLMQGKICNL